MCQSSPDDPDDLDSIVGCAAARVGVSVVSALVPALVPGPPAVPPTPGSPGSRRRRLWELESHAHCPVIGVCMPIAALRRLVEKVLGRAQAEDDYGLHCGVITECQQRTPVAEALQRELDRRYALPLRQAAKAKTTEALAAWWADAMRRHEVSGALWSTLTHARCTPGLAFTVLGDVHMLQHQAGMAARVDLDRFERLTDEHRTLTRELADARERVTRVAIEQSRRAEDQQAEIMQLRATVMARDARIGQLGDALQALQATVPGLKSRAALGHVNQRQADRIGDLERALLQSQREGERQRQRADERVLALHHRDANAPAAPDAEPALPEPAVCLNAQSVLCVGGRPAAVPLYRHIVEKVGGRFLHHDGGEEESSARLDATLAAADLVICQTGCISHNAYWRVKDHCKRTGKRCVFVETPSTAGIKRALLAMAPAPASR